MSSSITCPTCAASFRPAADVRGKKLSCPKCGKSMVVTGAGIAKRDEAAPVSAPPPGRQAPAAPPRRGLPWGWWAAAVVLAAAISVGAVLLLHNRRPSPSGGGAVAAGDGDGTELDGKLRRLGDGPAPGPTPPQTHDAPPAPRPPTVAVERLEPAEPTVGKTLTVFLKGTSPDDDALRYQFRTDPRGEWRPAPEGRVELPALEPGTLTLQVRDLDGHDQASDTVQRSWTVAASVPPAPPSVTVEPSGLVRLKELPPVTTDNPNQLIGQYRPQLTLTASSTWPGWPPENAIDGNIQTSWFSGQDDAAAKGREPWLQANFPADVPVSRVTILGNRDPAWLIGFTILEGSVTLYDKDGQILRTERNKGTGNYRDFDFRFSPPVEGVRAVRFTSLADQGDQTGFGDIAIADIQVD